MRKNIKIFIALILVYSIILIIKNQGTKTTITLPSEGERKSSYTQTYTVYNKQYYDIPLSEDWQDYIMSLCEEYNVDEKIIFATMYVESGYNFNANNPLCTGIMEINKGYAQYFCDTLNISNITSPENNIRCGVYLISLYYQKYGNYEKALTCYNCGEQGASKMCSSSYAKKIISYAENIGVK